MQSQIDGILLIPRAGDPNRFLTLGECGSRPPTAFKAYPGRVTSEEGIWVANEGNAAWGALAEALALLWKGRLVFAGVDSVERAWTPEHGRWLDQALLDIVEEKRISLGEDCPGTLVFVDQEGKELRRI